MTNKACKLNFSRIEDSRGNLTYIEHPENIPFNIKRVFWTYDVPSGEIRGGHAYILQQEVIIALSGSFDVVITHMNGSNERYHLNRPNFGLYMPPLVWRHMENFSTNSLGLHLSSSVFKEDDYLRDFDDFKKLKQ